MQGTFILASNKPKRFKTYKEEERQTDGFDKSKKTREKQRQRVDKRDRWESADN